MWGGIIVWRRRRGGVIMRFEQCVVIRCGVDEKKKKEGECVALRRKEG